ncbi:MAG TPA: CPBP family intramembrane glutamic endopeptidase [Gemmataceae bacterium]|nr:CPBP family intramembrane glutamic endopeptidase [Gemmataceae bacterium]
MAAKVTYFQATRHPWPSLLFLLPLLGAYEAGVLWLGGPQPDALRNGADAWLHWALQSVGVNFAYAPPLLIALFFLGWSYAARAKRPPDLVGVVSGMVIEAVFFALGLWGLSRAMGPVLDHFGIRLSWSPERVQAVGQAITFIGAGIYEEVVFRLVLFSGLALLLRALFLPALLAVPLAAVGSAVLFSAAHHVGPFGEPYQGEVFLFRLLAGIYFAGVYQARGFGVAAGAHALYDVVVGVAPR